MQMSQNHFALFSRVKDTISWSYERFLAICYIENLPLIFGNATQINYNGSLS